jgi:hypothetical protein
MIVPLSKLKSEFQHANHQGCSNQSRVKILQHDISSHDGIRDKNLTTNNTQASAPKLHLQELFNHLLLDHTNIFSINHL